MDGNVIGIISQAEAQAAKIKEEAEAQAAEIIAAAEKKAAEIIKSSEVSCAEYRQTSLAEAEKTAESEYIGSIESSRSRAKKYADGLISHSDGYVSDIVGRIVK